MANPFTKPTLTGYNPAPAPDTGRAGGTANIVRWSKHTDELTDPLRDFIQSLADQTETGFQGLFGTGDVDVLFVQSSAPAGWTQQTSQSDRVLRLTDGAGAVTGGSWTISGLTADGHALTSDEMPSHFHYVMRATSNNDSSPSGLSANNWLGWENSAAGANRNYVAASVESGDFVGRSGAFGGNDPHSHEVSSDSAWRPRYIDVIRCRRNFG